ncbi:multicopper oxidase domain-containing protein [Paenibacillus sp. LHD-117]|uniref:multicopper oxidase domain-containing protein n=1 Tax=Paenibacillus sp. LHD-117 TaxID=3071412 RepID=UPI0027E14114|nr:multicopper oxidase domain-containing protein [Paenibacillus sp. LHD-117]MDQ6422945.1 multicopper oxidase domain-containing protein [Paenibacillus sp. LHD-117]
MKHPKQKASQILNNSVIEKKNLSRRAFLKVGSLGAIGFALANLLPGSLQSKVNAEEVQGSKTSSSGHGHGGHMMSTKKNPTVMKHGHDPMKFLTHFDYGKESKLPNGQTLREYTIVAEDKEIEVAPGVFFPAWTYNGAVPGPTIRCTEGDRVKIRFINNGSHAHTIHFHGIHPANMDGSFEIVPPGGGTFTYEFDALPFGLHVYHCHTIPFTKHIAKGLYGTFIIDPKTPRPPAKEMVMVMNGYDTNFDGGNEFYTVNGVAFYYNDYPIKVKVGEKLRIYLSNMTEFDLINSFHLHGDMFRYYPTGTNLEQFELTDTIMQAQGQRGIIEFSFTHPGPFMFHAHVNEFTELGWLGLFEVEK